MIVLTGGKVYGIPNTNTTTTITEHVYKPQEVDIVIAAGKILALMNPSKTAAFVNNMKSQNLKILSVSVQNQLIIPGLIDVHVHAIGGGGEQGMFSITMHRMFSSIHILGPYSRTAESRLSELINGGLTTIVGILGTDGATRR